MLLLFMPLENSQGKKADSQNFVERLLRSAAIFRGTFQGELKIKVGISLSGMEVQHQVSSCCGESSE